jgi:hypothetical protein
MNHDEMNSLWQVPGMNKVFGRNHARYSTAINQADIKGKAAVRASISHLHGICCPLLTLRIPYYPVGSKQDNNSQDLKIASTKIEEEKEKLKIIKAEQLTLEDQLANTNAQAAAVRDKIATIQSVEIATLKEEAVLLTEEQTHLKDQGQILKKTLRSFPEDRFLGRNGEGNATYLRNLHHLHSKGDAMRLTLAELKSHLSYAVLLGMETNQNWIDAFGDMTTELQSVLGAPGNIPCHNRLTHKDAAEVVFHLYGLSPVETPSPPSKKRRRSRSVSRGRFNKKCRRMSAEELKLLAEASRIMQRVHEQNGSLSMGPDNFEDTGSD